jgi:hypothetical protein
VLCAFFGCLVTNAITGSQFQARFWTQGDWAVWLIIAAFGLSLIEFQVKAKTEIETEAAPLHSATGIPQFAKSAAACFCLLLLAGAATILLRPAKVFPTPPMEAEKRIFQEWLQKKMPAHPAAIGEFVCEPVQLGIYRAFLPAHSEPTNLARMFLRKPYDRTVALLRGVREPKLSRGSISAPRQSVPLSSSEFPGKDLRPLDPWQWYFFLGSRDVDPKALLGHDVVIHRAAALIPMDSKGMPDFDQAVLFPAP